MRGLKVAEVRGEQAAKGRGRRQPNPRRLRSYGLLRDSGVELTFDPADAVSVDDTLLNQWYVPLPPEQTLPAIREFVAYRRPDGHVAQSAVGDAGWETVNASQLAGAPPAADGVSAFTSVWNSIRHLVYRSTDSHVHEIWSFDGQAWFHRDLSAAAFAPSASSRPQSFVTQRADASGTYVETKHVVYRAGNQLVLLTSHNGGAWTWTTIATPKGVKFTPTVYSTQEGQSYQTPHVVYVDLDGHVRDTWRLSTGAWSEKDLTFVTGAPPAASSPFGQVMYDLNSAEVETQHVLYKAVDGRIIELWTFGSWNYTILTPTAADMPAATSYDDEVNGGQGRQVVGFRRPSDNPLIVMQNATGLAWAQHDLTVELSMNVCVADNVIAYVTNYWRTPIVLCTDADGNLQETYYNVWAARWERGTNLPGGAVSGAAPGVGGSVGDSGLAARTARRAWAARYPDRYTVFFAHGNNVPGTPGGSGSLIEGGMMFFASGPDIGGGGLFAHETGHYLGLAHTQVYAQVASADFWALVNTAAGTDDLKLANFEGDGLADTPPDPGYDFSLWGGLQCAADVARTLTHPSNASIRVNLGPDRANVMSYSTCSALAQRLSGDQTSRVRSLLEAPTSRRHRLIAP